MIGQYHLHTRAFHRRLERCHKVEEKTKSKAPTFENERPVRIPDIVKRPCITTKFEKYTTQGVGENTDWFGVVGMPIFLSRLSVEFLPICI
jgi:hypothetical protein